MVAGWCCRCLGTPGKDGYVKYSCFVTKVRANFGKLPKTLIIKIGRYITAL